MIRYTIFWYLPTQPALWAASYVPNDIMFIVIIKALQFLVQNYISFNVFMNIIFLTLSGEDIVAEEVDPAAQYSEAFGLDSNYGR